MALERMHFMSIDLFQPLQMGVVLLLVSHNLFPCPPLHHALSCIASVDSTIYLPPVVAVNHELTISSASTGLSYGTICPAPVTFRSC
jgi:hypothetical protein